MERSEIAVQKEVRKGEAITCQAWMERCGVSCGANLSGQTPTNHKPLRWRGRWGAIKVQAHTPVSRSCGGAVQVRVDLARRRLAGYRSQIGNS
jgi:hypothetical protein